MACVHVHCIAKLSGHVLIGKSQCNVPFLASRYLETGSFYHALQCSLNPLFWCTASNFHTYLKHMHKHTHKHVLYSQQMPIVDELSV